jgi:CBS domain-containing protein
MSPRAAARLEAMGFTQVYDYVGGKKDWLTADLPTEGDRAGERRSGSLARQDLPTCRPDDSLGDVLQRPDLEAWGVCVVTDTDGVVHGLLTLSDIADGPESARAEETMQLGPTTIRPNRSIESAMRLMDDDETDFLLVTTEFGELLGILCREDAQSYANSFVRGIT